MGHLPVFVPVSPYLDAMLLSSSLASLIDCCDAGSLDVLLLYNLRRFMLHVGLLEYPNPLGSYIRIISNRHYKCASMSPRMKYWILHGQAL
jgi:hypothetical protein